MDLTPGPPEDQKRSDEQEDGFVWAVVFSNYEPAEIDMLYATRALAEGRAEKLGDDWHVQRWAIQGWQPAQCKTCSSPCRCTCHQANQPRTPEASETQTPTAGGEQ